MGEKEGGRVGKESEREGGRAMGVNMGGAEPAAPLSLAHHFGRGGGESFSNHKIWGGEGGERGVALYHVSKCWDT